MMSMVGHWGAHWTESGQYCGRPSRRRDVAAEIWAGASMNRMETFRRPALEKRHDANSRVEFSMVRICDGLTLAKNRP